MISTKRQVIQVGRHSLRIIMVVAMLSVYWSATTPRVVSAAGIVHVSGDVSTNTLWTANNVYVVDSTLTVDAGITLTVQPSTTVKIASSGYIAVYGNLALQNTVYFTSLRDDLLGGDTNGDQNHTVPAPGDWRGIYLVSPSASFLNAWVGYSVNGVVVYNITAGTATNEIGNSTFSNNIVGATLWNVDNGHITSSIHNNAFTHNSYGLVVTTTSGFVGQAAPTLQSNNFNNTATFPIYLESSAYPTYAGNTFNTNAHPAIALAGTWYGSGSWTVVNNMPYVVEGDVLIDHAATITLPVGTILKFDLGRNLDAQGTLDLMSTGVTSPTIFTSYRDDRYGGDTNGDGLCPSCTNEPQLGDWNTVYLENSATNFGYALVRYGTRGLLIEQAGSGDLAPSIHNSLFDSNLTGLYFFTPGDGRIVSAVSNNVISNTGSGFPIYLNGTAFPTFSGNTFHNSQHPAVGLAGEWRSSGTWALVNGMPYVLNGDTQVDQSATLTLPVNMVMKAAAGRTLEVTGTLELQGTGPNPTIFTSYNDDSYAGDTNGDGAVSRPARGDWNGIYLDANGTNFDFATVKYATTGVKLNNIDPAHITLQVPITSSTFSENIAGVYLYSGQGNVTPVVQGNTFFSNTYGLATATAGPAGFTAFPSLINNAFTHNTGFPIYLNGSAYPTYSGNTFANNTHPAIGLGNDFNVSGTWTLVNNMPYVVVNDVFVQLGATVALPVGTVIKFDLGRTLYVSGTLDMQSTPTVPMTFTSYLDDSVDGDTNADGSATSPKPADWSGIFLLNNGTNFDFAAAKYANTGVRVENDGGLAGTLTDPITSSTFINDVFGIFLYAGGGYVTSLVQNNTFNHNMYGFGTGSAPDTYGSTPNLVNNAFNNSLSFPIYLAGSAFPTYSGNTFSNNVHAAIGLANYFNTSGTWTIVNNMPYVITGDVYINYFAIATVPAGEIFKFDTGRYLHVWGTLNLQSSGATQPVVFTSYKDDTYAGDTNADGNASTPAKADWKTVWLYNNLASLNYAVFKYATAGLGVYYEGPVNTNLLGTIANDTFNSNLAGVLLAIGQNPHDPATGYGNIATTIQNNVFTGNSYGLTTFVDPAASGAVVPTLSSNVFDGDAGFPIFLGGTSYPIYSGNSAAAPTWKPSAPNKPQSVEAGGPVTPTTSNPRLPKVITGDSGPIPNLDLVDPQAPEAPSSNTFSNNVHPAIGLAGTYNAPGTWSRLSGMAYVVNGGFPIIVNNMLATDDINIGVNASVSLPPSTDIKFNTGRSMSVYGALASLGSQSHPVALTSYKDDTQDGDTNADGGQTAPAKADWHALYLYGSGTVLNFVAIKYSDVGIVILYAGPVSTNIYPEVIHSSIVENNVGMYLVIAGDGDITSLIHDNIFINNGTHIRGQINSGNGRLLTTIVDNDFYGSKSGPYGINNLATTAAITGTMNWWGAASGPYHPSLNSGGQGTPVSDYVKFVPWRGSPSQVATTYSILGQVTDGDAHNPQPISGVTIKLNSGTVMTTSVGGYYSFGSLPPGTYTVTAVLGGYTFYPAARVVSLPFDARGVNFSASPVAGPRLLFIPLIRR